jgi:hypothetical protein
LRRDAVKFGRLVQNFQSKLPRPENKRNIYTLKSLSARTFENFIAIYQGTERHNPERRILVGFRTQQESQSIRRVNINIYRKESGYGKQ